MLAMARRACHNPTGPLVMNAFRLDSVARRRILVLLSLPLVALVLAGVVGARDGRSPDSTLRELKTFSEVLQLTGRNYVDEVELRQLERGAYQGLAESLDPWSSLHDPRRLAELAVSGSGGSIGVLLLKHPQQYVRVVVVVPGSPAEEAGVKAGQFLETIDGLATKDIALLEAEAMLRGAPGTIVKLGFFRSSDEEERGKVVEVPRRDLSALRVVEQRLDSRTALLRLTDTAPGARDLVASRLAGLREAGVRDLVLDLRRNVGGSPDEALAIADLLAPAGAAFQRVTKSGTSTAATRDPEAWEGGLVVLVERGTVGEAELLAEALRTLKGAKLVGGPTLGKTTQQDLVRLTSGLGLSLSVAEYRRADGSPFDVAGLEPDEKVARGARRVEFPASDAPGEAPGEAKPEAPDAAAPTDEPGAEGLDSLEESVPEPLEPGEPADTEGDAGAPGGGADAQLEKALELLKAAAAAAEQPPARKAA